MSSRATTILLAAAMTMAAGITASNAGPNKNFGTCGAGAERTVCEQVALCERNGGEPYRPWFSTSLTCCFGDRCTAMSELTEKASSGAAGNAQ